MICMLLGLMVCWQLEAHDLRPEPQAVGGHDLRPEPQAVGGFDLRPEPQVAGGLDVLIDERRKNPHPGPEGAEVLCG